MTPFSPSLGPLVWTQLWQVTAVAAVVGLVVRLCCRQRPHLAYVLWLVVLVKSLTPPLWSSPTSLFSWAALDAATSTTGTSFAADTGPGEAISADLILPPRSDVPNDPAGQELPPADVQRRRPSSAPTRRPRPRRSETPRWPRFWAWPG